MSNKNKKTENSRLSRKDLIKNIIGKTPRKKFLSEGQEEYYKIRKNNNCKTSSRGRRKVRCVAR